MVRFFLQSVRRWWNSAYNRQALITIEISETALLSNFRALQLLVPEWRIAPVLKSNAYGHGLVPVARVLARQKGVAFFCVDSHFEANILTSTGVTTPLLVMGYTPTEIVRKNKHPNLSFMVGSLEQLGQLIASGSCQSVHLKFDTGMHRQGVQYERLNEVVHILEERNYLRIDGIMSHFADAENPNREQTEKQIARWNELTAVLRKKFPHIRYYHLANSAGYAHAQKIFANVGRPGIALYGINPGNLRVALKPILRMTSRVSDIRIIPTGERLGYNGTFASRRDTKVATIPAGYFEGIDLRLSNLGVFLIKNKEVPICGRVSMNISSCNVTDIEGVSPDTSVTLISNRETDKNSIQNIAGICGTISYEILTHLPSHLRRNVVASFE
ncbi:alanine racemase [Candidatus Kaiserbacteria bacterium]|nr:alanine racemase [Candidatus Kaiserbacteria bacterium]